MLSENNGENINSDFLAVQMSQFCQKTLSKSTALSYIIL